MTRAVLGAGLLVSTLAGCGWSWSGDDSSQLRTAIDELASVGGPGGQEPSSVEVWDCDRPAEMPQGAAIFPYDGIETSATSTREEIDASNAELEDLNEWYAARWEELGWSVRGEHPEVTKEVDGKRLRATVDANNGSTYLITVVRDGAPLCE
jgi:hypothetical protein